MGKRKDLTGLKSGKLTILRFAYAENNIAYWECECECGTRKIIKAQSLIESKTKTCGGTVHRLSDDISKRRREHTPIVCAIYKITNPNGLVYIGSSRTVYKRWLRHREGNKKTRLHASIRQYGWKEHKFEIVHELPKDISNDKLIEIEQVYIDAYRNCRVDMLNVKDAGSKAKFSEESKLKMSLAQKGKIPWNKGVRGMQIAWNKKQTA